MKNLIWFKHMATENVHVNNFTSNDYNDGNVWIRLTQVIQSERQSMIRKNNI